MQYFLCILIVTIDLMMILPAVTTAREKERKPFLFFCEGEEKMA
jgi:hypothetical protein